MEASARRRLALSLLAAAAALGGAVVWAAPASLSPRDTLPSYGDPLQLAFVLQWNARQLVRNPLGLFDAPTFHPYARSLAFGDHLLVESLLVAPVSWATGNAVLGYTACVVLTLALAALAMGVLVGSTTRSPAAGLVAGAAFGFNSFTANHLAQVNILSVEWWPLAVLALAQLAAGGSPRAAALFVAALALQGLSYVYYLLYGALLGPLWLLLAYGTAGRPPSPRELRALALAAVAVAGPALFVTLPYVDHFRRLGLPARPEPGLEAASFLHPSGDNAFWGPGLGGWNFVGFFTLALALTGLVRLRREEGHVGRTVAARTAALTAGLAFLASIAPTTGLGGLRFTGRAFVLVLVGVGILAGLGADVLLGRLRGAARAGAAAVLALLLPAEHWHAAREAGPFPTPGDQPAAHRWLAGPEAPPGPVVDLPVPSERARKIWGAPMLFSTVHGRRVLFGRSSYYPPLHETLAWRLRTFPDAATLTALDRLGVRTVVVHPRQWPEGERASRLAALTAHPGLDRLRTFTDTLPARYEALGLGQEQVFVVRPTARAAVPCRPADALPRAGLAARSPTAPGADRALDGDPTTAWSTAEPQTAGDALRLLLPRAATLAAVALDHSHDEFGRGVVLETRQGGAWVRVSYADGPEERWELLDQLVREPRQARHVLRFPPHATDGVRLSVAPEGDVAVLPRWSVPEVHLYGACR